jgi:hypothetical protein
MDLAEHAPPIIEMLAGSYATQDPHFDDLADCARILDDAIDENQPIHRKILLRSQPMYWRAVGRLAARHYSLWEDAAQLIDETIVNVEADDCTITPESWGGKNHHLLLIPLLLSGNDSAYRKCRNGLSRILWILQSGDELRQGRLHPVQGEFLHGLITFFASPMLEELALHGWKTAAERGVWEAKQILKVMQSKGW